MSRNRNITFLELKSKEIVNIVDGRRLGRIIDLVFTCSGCVIGFVAPASRKVFRSLNCNENIFIPWNNVCKIGDDVILVELMCNRVNSFSVDEENNENNS